MTLFDDQLPPSVDMHCHVSDAGGYSKITTGSLVLSVTNDPRAWQAVAGSNVDHRGIAWAVGLHPCVQRDEDPRLATLLAAMPSADAIGEVGLDYSRRASASPASQRKILDTVLASPYCKDRLVTIHSAQATKDVTSALEEHRPPGAILHWFLGSRDDIERLIQVDTYFSVNSAMFRSKRGSLAISEMPPNRVLVETDAPYVKRGSTPLNAGQVAPAERALANLWEVELDEVRRRLWRNFRSLSDRVDVKLFADQFQEE